MVPLRELMDKEIKLVIGLMSGTSVDGIDAALTEITGFGTDTRVKLLHFINTPYSTDIKNRIASLFDQKIGSSVICHMNFLLGELFAEAAINLCQSYGIDINEVDLIGSHGQTIYHSPEPVEDCGYTLRSTLQIGETAVIAQRTGAVTVGNFRVKDMAAGGNGAPLVPYTEYLLYRSDTQNIALQNIGGIGNITLLPQRCSMSDIIAFDTGPGNMVMDVAIAELTDGKLLYDKDGMMAASGTVCKPLLNELLCDSYFSAPPPKTTGREYFGQAYTKELLHKSQLLGLTNADIMATATALTAQSIKLSIDRFIPDKQRPEILIIGGGGSYNSCLLNFLKESLPDIHVVTNEELGFNSDAKEAVAFAILANETINSHPGNVPSATGAKSAVILGKISQ